VSARRPVVTVTLNPSIDGSCEAETIRPVRKIRTTNERFDPGGGGINVARVVRELGGDAFAVYLAGQVTGDVLDRLVGEAGVPFHRIHIGEPTRVSHVVYERASGKEFRFTPEGPVVEPDALERLLAFLGYLDLDLLVMSGSLPRGLPDDAIGQIAGFAKAHGARLLVDSSGAGLKAAAAAGVYLLKPSAGELVQLVGRELPERRQQIAAARELVARGAAEVVAVSLGHEGALLVTAELAEHLPAPDVPVRSAVGAGDAFVGAMAAALAAGAAPRDAFARGVAAGTATVLTTGTGLCRRADVERLHAMILEARDRGA
jgi:6-phosphofructokinase 2